MHWPDTRALWRLYAGRTPSDRDPGADHDRDPAPCDCGEAFLSSTHILLECRLFRRARARMLQKAPNTTISNVLQPAHTPAVVEFLRTTRLGYTADLTTDDRKGGDEEEGEAEGDSGEGGEEEDGGGGVEELEEDLEALGAAGDAEEVMDAGEWRFGLFE
jgi:hypothetical protein